MIRKTFLPALILLAACDVTQELQGDPADGGSNPPTADGGRSSSGDGGTNPVTDAGVIDAAPQRPVSVCTPQSAIGTTSVAVTGGENPYFHNVTDLALGAGRVFALSEPWTFVGIPTGGGAAVGYDVSATLPNFIAMAIAKTDTSPSGALTSLALASFNLPTGGGQIVALRGPSSGNAIDVGGRVFVDQDDVFYFTKQGASRLVHAATKANPTEQLLVEYPTASETVVTAAAPLGNYVYFASAVIQSLSVKSSMLHRVPRTGGTVEDLAPTTTWGLIGDIYQDGDSLYVTPGAQNGWHPTNFGIYSMLTGTTTSGSLQGLGDSVAYTRSSGIAFDGTSFYYGAGPNMGGCSGKIVRVSKATAIFHSSDKADILATNLDLPVRVLANSGTLYVGTMGDPFFKPTGYSGQMLRWTP